MSRWIAMESSTSTGTVAVFEAAQCVAERAVAMKGAEEERLMPAVVELVQLTGGWDGISRIVVGAGPGSFTSLRIAASIGKGLAASLGAGLWAVPSLGLAVAQGAPVVPGQYVAVLDALRGEWFASAVTVGADGQVLAVGLALRVSSEGLRAMAARDGARIVGPSGPVDVVSAPHARGAGALLARGIGAQVDLATWEPDYGRLAEAQVKWEAAHGRPLGTGA